MKKEEIMRKVMNLLISLSLLALPSCTALKSHGLAPVKYGYVDKGGRMVINPQFDDADSFAGGLARVKIGNWGYINKSGKFIINPQFDGADNFYEDLARVKIDHKYGYINKEGKIVINPTFDEGYNFSDGLARVEIGRQTGYINKMGKIVINPQFDTDDAMFLDGDIVIVTVGQGPDKASLQEGGSHVPMIANWPGTTPAGAVNHDLTDFTDFFTTFAELGGDMPLLPARMLNEVFPDFTPKPH